MPRAKPNNPAKSSTPPTSPPPVTDASPVASPLSPKSAAWRAGIVVAVGVAMAVLVLRQTKWVNGPWYWEWRWRRLTWMTYPLLIAAALPAFAAIALHARKRIGARGGVALLMLATFAMQMATSAVQPPGIRWIVRSVEDPSTTSYYTVAALIDAQEQATGLTVGTWLAFYPEIMPRLMLHASFKPPGWALYYLLWIKLFGLSSTAAAVAAIGVALMACGGVVATYALLRHFSVPRDAAFSAAAFFAMTPSLVLFFPQGDQAYPLLGCAMIIAWSVALRRRGRIGYAAAALFGALLALGLFFSAVFLMFGVILAVVTMLSIADEGDGGRAGGGAARGLMRAVERTVVAVLVIFVFYALLTIFTGFDPIETFQTSAARSQAHLVELQRPWPLHSALDVVDIVMGTGWISVPLVAWGVWATWRTQGWRSPTFRLVLLGLLNVVTAVAVAVFPGENARLMLPLMPLLMAPIGIELSRWPLRLRLVVYATLLLATTTIGQNMEFLKIDPDYHFQLKPHVPLEATPP